MTNRSSNVLLSRSNGLPTTIVLLVCLIYAAIILINAGGSPHALIDYDGYYSYDIAHDFLEVPFTGDLDKPAYRFQRIFYPLAARILALGQPDLIPWTLIFLNIFAISAGTWLIELLLSDLNVNRWYALAYGLYGGQLLGLRTSVSEPMTHMLLVAAMLAWQRDKRWWAVIAFSLAGLTKETALIFVAAYALHALLQRDWRWVLGLSASLILWFVWQGVLWVWLGETGLGATEPFIWIPLGGWLMAARINFLGFLLISLMIVPMSIIPALIGIFLSGRSLWQRNYHPFVLSLLLNALFILFLPFPTFRESSAMVRITQGLALSMLLYGALMKSSRILNYSLLWIFTNVLHLKGSGRPFSLRMGR